MSANQLDFFFREIHATNNRFTTFRRSKSSFHICRLFHQRCHQRSSGTSFTGLLSLSHETSHSSYNTAALVILQSSESNSKGSCNTQENSGSSSRFGLGCHGTVSSGTVHWWRFTISSARIITIIYVYYNITIRSNCYCITTSVIRPSPTPASRVPCRVVT